MNRKTSKEIFEQVKVNQKKLKDCLGPHDFVRLEDKIFSKYKCSICGGEVESIYFHAYNDGINHMKLSLKDDVKSWIKRVG